MASLTVRNLDEPTKVKLRIRAAENGRSMEEEVRQILADAVSGRTPSRRAGEPERELGLAERIRQRVLSLDGVDVPAIAREPMRDPPDFA